MLTQSQRFQIFTQTRFHGSIHWCQEMNVVINEMEGMVKSFLKVGLEVGSVPGIGKAFDIHDLLFISALKFNWLSHLPELCNFFF